MIWYMLLAMSISGLYIGRGYIKTIYGFFKYKHDNNSEAIKISKRLLAIPYQYQHHQYYALLPIKHKSINILNVYSNSIDILVDVTQNIKQYLGHNNDFTNCQITPKILGYPDLKFNIMDNTGTIKTLYFGENDIISFNTSEE